MKTYFRAPWGARLKFMTGGTILLLIVSFFYVDFEGAIFVIGILLICTLLAIQGYSIENGMLKIHRIGWTKDFNLKNLTSAEFNPVATAGSIRTFGIGGLFGFIGYFHNSFLGNYRAYATDMSDSVVLNFEGKKVVITPEQPSEFVKTIQRLMKDTGNGNRQVK